jgi:hypothetical protein
MLASGSIQSFSTFSPDQLKIVRDVYIDISHRPWFDQDAVKKEEFARYVIMMYQRGLIIPEKLHGLCMVAAKRKFSRTKVQYREQVRA